MGFIEGEGLGKQGQGITEPVKASLQKGRRGLGLQLKGFEPADVNWDFEKEKVSDYLFDHVFVHAKRLHITILLFCLIFSASCLCLMKLFIVFYDTASLRCICCFVGFS